MRDVDVAAMAWREGWARGSSQGIYLGGSAPMGKPSFLVGRHFQDRTLEAGDNLSFLSEEHFAESGYIHGENWMIAVFGADEAQVDDIAEKLGGEVIRYGED